METLTGLLKKGQEILVQAGIEEAGLDARLLLEYITGKSRAYYLAHGEECVTKETADRYLELVTGRSQHIPLQHLTHQAFFMGYEFYVNEDVLIPRQDTETLVEEALRLLKDFFHKLPGNTVWKESDEIVEGMPADRKYSFKTGAISFLGMD